LPYVSMDDIAFQAISDNTITSVMMTDIGGEPIEVANSEITRSENYYLIKPKFTNKPDCFRVVLLSNGNIISGKSNIFVRKDNGDYSSRVEYRSAGDNFGFAYNENLFLNSVRLPVYLLDPKFTQAREVYGTLSGRKKILSASVRNEYDLDTDYMTEEMHRNLIVALMHDEVYIDGRLLTQTGDYSVDWDNYLMDGDTKTAKGKCTVSANVVSRSSNCSKMQLVNDEYDLIN